LAREAKDNAVSDTQDRLRLDLSGRKNIIGMVHLLALPGTPFHRGESVQQILDAAMRDRDSLVEAGFDAISISNDGDRPYVTAIPREQVAIFTHIMSRLTHDLPLPFGCGLLIDPKASLAAAHAVGADFIRLSFGTLVGSYGILTEQPGEILRYRRHIGADGVRLLLNLSAHFSTSLDTRPLAEIVKTTTWLVEPDAIQVHGDGAGIPPSMDEVKAVRAVAADTPIIVASGVDEASIADVLALADGVIVGTSLKHGRKIWNPIDPVRAQAFMARARDSRGY
jgi:membrane complex biogenesis BtpA family protein